jgi:hypothetical protein
VEQIPHGRWRIRPGVEQCLAHQLRQAYARRDCSRAPDRFAGRSRRPSTTSLSPERDVGDVAHLGRSGSAHGERSNRFPVTGRACRLSVASGSKCPLSLPRRPPLFSGFALKSSV